MDRRLESQRELIHRLSDIFTDREIDLSAFAEGISGFTDRDKDEISKTEDDEYNRSLDVFFDRLQKMPMWEERFMKGIINMSNDNPALCPPDLFDKVVIALGTLKLVVEPGFIIDRLGKHCLSGNHCSQASHADLPNCLADIDYTHLVKSKYSVFKENLCGLKEVMDYLIEYSPNKVFTSDDQEEVLLCCRFRRQIDCLLKKVLQSGRSLELCKIFLSAIHDCDHLKFILETQSEFLTAKNIEVTLNQISELEHRIARDCQMLLPRFPEPEYAIDYMIETDVFSVDDHDYVMAKNSKPKRVLALLDKLRNNKEVMKVFLQAWYILEYPHWQHNESIASDETIPKRLRCEIDGNQLLLPNDDTIPKRLWYEIDGSPLLLAEDISQGIEIRITTKHVLEKELMKRLLLPSVRDEVDELTLRLSKLKITDVTEGSVIIKLEPASTESLTMLREAYLNGNLAEMFSSIFEKTGIAHLAKDDNVTIRIEIEVLGSEVRKLEESKHTKILKRNRNFLLEELDPFNVVVSMKDRGVFTGQQAEWIMNKQPRDRKTRVSEIINLLKRMDLSCFEKFTECLTKGTQAYIVKQLEIEINPDIIRKKIKDDQALIAEQMHIGVIQKLYLQLPNFPREIPYNKIATDGIGMQILDHILTESNDVVELFADIMVASGLGSLIVEEMKQTSTDYRIAETDVYKQTFEKILKQMSNLDLVPHFTRQVESDGQLHVYLHPSNLKELESINTVDIQASVNSLIKECVESGRIQISTGQLDTSIEDISVSLEMDEYMFDTAMSWFNKDQEMTKELEADSSLEFVRNELKSFSKHHVTKLSLSRVNLHNVDAVIGLQFVPNLEILELNGCGLADRGLEVLAGEMVDLKYLVIIDIGNNQFTAKGLAVLNQRISCFNHVRILRIQKNKLGLEGGKVLAELLKKMPKIEILNLSGCDLKDGVQPISEVLADRKIHRINLRENKIGWDQSAYLFKRLCKSRYLQYLDYSGNEIGLSPPSAPERVQFIPGLMDKLGKTPVAFTELLKSNSECWDYVCLWNCGLQYTSLFRDPAHFEFLKGVTSLILQENALGNDFAVVLGSAMKKDMISLRHLNLRKNCIENKGGLALADGLKSNLKLKEFILDRNEITEARVMMELFNCLTTPEHKKMTELDLSLNTISNVQGPEYIELKEALTKRGETTVDEKVVKIKYGDLTVTF